MTKNIFLLSLCLYLFSMFRANGQDVILSQYQSQPSLSNAASTNINSDMRFWLSYRNQSLSSDNQFQTVLASAAYPFLKKDNLQNQTWGGIGISFFADNQAQFLKTTGAFANFQYHFHLSKSLLSVALQGGFFQQSLTYENLITDSQIASGQLNLGIGNQEALDNPQVSYATIGLSAYWTQLNENQAPNYFLGLAWNLANQPNISFDRQNQYNLPANLTLQGGFRIGKAQKFSVTPNLRYIYRLGVSELMAGTWLNYDLRSFGNLFAQGEMRLGAWYQTQGLASMSLELHQSNFFMILGYDLGIKSQDQVNNNAWEATLGLKIAKKSKANSLYPGTILPEKPN